MSLLTIQDQSYTSKKLGLKYALGDAYRKVGVAFKGQLEQHFVVLKDGSAARASAGKGSQRYGSGDRGRGGGAGQGRGRGSNVNVTAPNSNPQQGRKRQNEDKDLGDAPRNPSDGWSRAGKAKKAVADAGVDEIDLADAAIAPVQSTSSSTKMNWS